MEIYSGWYRGPCSRWVMFGEVWREDGAEVIDLD
jgi:hypothetical protein